MPFCDKAHLLVLLLNKLRRSGQLDLAAPVPGAEPNLQRCIRTVRFPFASRFGTGNEFCADSGQKLGPPSFVPINNGLPVSRDGRYFLTKRPTVTILVTDQ